MSSVLIFAGSTRAQSFNRKLAAVAAASAARQFPATKVTHIELADFELPLYQAELEAQGTPHNALKLKALMHAHDAWMICSPEYNGGLTGLLKNTLDWASSPAKAGQLHDKSIEAEWGDGLKPFRGKVVGVLAASPGATGGLRAMGDLSKLLLNLQCWVSPEQFALGRAGSAFGPDGGLLDATVQQRVDAVVAMAVQAAGKLAKSL